jgi:hypothetical protein
VPLVSPLSGPDILVSNALAIDVHEIQVYGVQGSQEPHLCYVILHLFAKYAGKKIEGCSK